MILMIRNDGDHDLILSNLDQDYHPKNQKNQFEETIHSNQIEDCPIND